METRLSAAGPVLHLIWDGRLLWLRHAVPCLVTVEYDQPYPWDVIDIPGGSGASGRPTGVHARCRLGRTASFGTSCESSLSAPNPVAVLFSAPVLSFFHDPERVTR
jgi:hypothetical protein